MPDYFRLLDPSLADLKRACSCAAGVTEVVEDVCPFGSCSGEQIAAPLITGGSHRLFSPYKAPVAHGRAPDLRRRLMVARRSLNEAAGRQHLH